VASFFVEAKGAAIKHGLARLSADVSDIDWSAWAFLPPGLDLWLRLSCAPTDCGVIRCCAGLPLVRETAFLRVRVCACRLVPFLGLKRPLVTHAGMLKIDVWLL
jgi:hypothetical protein